MTPEMRAALRSLTRDVTNASMNVNRDELRFVVDYYYAVQKPRIASGNQVQALTGSGQPSETLNFFHDLDKWIEVRIREILQAHSDSREPGMWVQSIVGLGPVIAAALMAYVDITRCQTAGSLWRYAGLDPTCIWYKKDETAVAEINRVCPPRTRLTEEHVAQIAENTSRRFDVLLRFATTNRQGEPVSLTRDSLTKALKRRPFNAEMKTLAYKIGDCIIKNKNSGSVEYGRIYDARKAYETAKNENGEYADQAASKLESYNIRNAEHRRMYRSGKLPPGHIHARCRRYMVKIFLSHYHHVAYRLHFGINPPRPFALDILEHTHMIEIPNFVDGRVIVPEQTEGG